MAKERRTAAIASVAVGLLAMAAAALILAFADTSDPSATGEPAGVAAPDGQARPANVGLSENRYAPGHSSGWHAHPGVHSVVVLSGTLTIYDHDCVRHDYGAGDSYLGGRQSHLARNEGSETVAMVVTYVSSPSDVDHGAVVEAPVDCAAR